MRTIVLALIAVALFALNDTPNLASQSAVNVIGRKEAIPVGYKTYSLFLICNPEWLEPSMGSDLSDLYLKFVAFGRSIGDDQAAVWFWKTTVGPKWESVMLPSAALDVERSINFCKAWKLKPSGGPYLVVTSSRPDESHLSGGLPDGIAIFALGGLNPSQISVLLGKLTDSLLLTGKVESVVASGGTAASDSSKPENSAGQASATGQPPGSDAIWIRILGAAQELITQFGCAVSLKVNAGPLQADLKSCKGSS